MTNTREAPCATQRPTIPGEPGAWVLILGDMCVFGLFFATFAYYQANDAASFSMWRSTLDTELGAMNTCILLCSSWFVVLATQRFRHANPRNPGALIIAAMLCGLTFIGIKIFEYRSVFDHVEDPFVIEFFMFYFMLTGIHLVHVVVGTGLLAAIAWHIHRTPALQRSQRFAEVAGCYWHMVDVLWVMIFSLLYLQA